MTKAEREQMLREKLAAMKAFERGAVEDLAGARPDAGEKDAAPFYIAGIDEVGRGPLAGPVVTCCVILPPDFDLLGVDDSKKLSEKKRDELFDIIIEKAIAFKISFIEFLIALFIARKKTFRLIKYLPQNEDFFCQFNFSLYF